MENSTTIIPFKKRKLDVCNDEVFTNDEDDYDDNTATVIVVPGTENKRRKKCAKTDEGLAIKYNKLMFNFDKIVKSKRFRKYFVFFDLYSKRHLINHNYRIDYLKILNCFDFTSYSHKTCTCKSKLTCFGFILCFKEEFMYRKKYCNHKENKSEYMTKLYEKHSILHEDNNFFDNKINSPFLQKIQEFETLSPIDCLDRKTMKIFLKNSYNNRMLRDSTPFNICKKCKNIASTDFSSWNIIHYSNRLNKKQLENKILKLDNLYMIPSFYTYEKFNESKRLHIVVYKTTKSNIVFIYNNTFHVINQRNVIIVFDIEFFKHVKFFCNFNFYFVNISNSCTETENIININKF